MWTKLLFEVNGEQYIVPLSIRNGLICSHYKYYAGLIPLSDWKSADLALSGLLKFLENDRERFRGLLLSYLDISVPNGYLNVLLRAHSPYGARVYQRPYSASILFVNQPWEKVWNDVYGSKTRNMVRKAQKQGILCRMIDPLEHISDIIACTLSDSHRHGRDFPAHYMDPELFEKDCRQEQENFGEKYQAFGAFVEDKLVAYIITFDMGAEIICNSLLDNITYRTYSPMNALWAYVTEHYCNEKHAQWLMYGFHDLESVNKFKESIGFMAVPVWQLFFPFHQYNYKSLLQQIQ